MVSSGEGASKFRRGVGCEHSLPNPEIEMEPSASNSDIACSSRHESGVFVETADHQPVYAEVVILVDGMVVRLEREGALA